jgi:Lon protease-like protein
MLDVPVVEPAYDSLPVFPLPGFVLFPHTMTKLHVYEKRYRLLASDALATNRLIVLAGLKPGWEGDYEGTPPVHDVGSLCKIVNDERTEDGRYNLYLHCLARVRLTTLHRLLPYRTASVTVVPDVPVDPQRLDQAMQRLLGTVRGLVMKLGEHGGALAAVLQATRKPALLTHRLAAALAADAVARQELLETADPAERAEKLAEIAGELLLRSELPNVELPAVDASMVN